MNAEQVIATPREAVFSWRVPMLALAMPSINVSDPQVRLQRFTFTVLVPGGLNGGMVVRNVTEGQFSEAYSASVSGLLPGRTHSGSIVTVFSNPNLEGPAFPITITTPAEGELALC